MQCENPLLGYCEEFNGCDCWGWESGRTLKGLGRAGVADETGPRAITCTEELRGRWRLGEYVRSTKPSSPPQTKPPWFQRSLWVYARYSSVPLRYKILDCDSWVGTLPGRAPTYDDCRNSHYHRCHKASHMPHPIFIPTVTVAKTPDVPLINIYLRNTPRCWLRTGRR